MDITVEVPATVEDRRLEKLQRDALKGPGTTVKEKSFWT
jgi:hypothetical protein